MDNDTLTAADRAKVEAEIAALLAECPTFSDDGPVITETSIGDVYLWDDGTVTAWDGRAL